MTAYDSRSSSWSCLRCRSHVLFGSQDWWILFGAPLRLIQDLRDVEHDAVESVRGGAGTETVASKRTQTVASGNYHEFTQTLVFGM